MRLKEGMRGLTAEGQGMEEWVRDGVRKTERDRNREREFDYMKREEKVDGDKYVRSFNVIINSI